MRATRFNLTQKNNLLLASFLGWKQNSIGSFGHVQNIGRELYNPVTANTRASSPAYLAFDSSWEWIMLVVDAVERMGYNVNMPKFNDQYVCTINDGITSYKGIHSVLPKKAQADRRLLAVYGAMVEFARWHYKETNQVITYQLS